MPDAHGRFKGISVPAAAWDRIFRQMVDADYAAQLEQLKRDHPDWHIRPGQALKN